MKIKYISILLLLFAITRSNAQDTASISYIKPLFDFEPSKPLFELNETQQENKYRNLRFSAFTCYREGLQPVKREYGFNIASEHNNQTGTTSQRMYNLSIEEMLTHGVIKDHQVILEVKDPSKYRYRPQYGPKLEWLRKNAYCYELTVPQKEFKNLDPVEDEIASHFGLSYAREKRNVKVLLLSLEDPKKQAKVILSPDAIDFVQLVQLFYDSGLPIPINKAPRSDIKFNLTKEAITKASDLPAIKKTLAEQGYTLTESSMELSFLVIREIK